MNYRNLLLCIFFLWNFSTISSQCNPAPEDQCDGITAICSIAELNGFSCQTASYTGFQNQCYGNGCVTKLDGLNTSWWAFHGTSGTTTLTISYNSCTNAYGFPPSGIQIGLYQNGCCENNVICQSTCTGAAGGTFSYTLNLKPCALYALCINGCDGDVCNYSISTSQSNSNYFDDFALTQSQNNPICQGCCIDFVVTEQANGCKPHYIWTVNGEEFENDFKPKANICFPDEGIFTICVEARLETNGNSICQSKSKCVNVTSLRLKDGIAKSQKLCTYQIPYKWHNQIVTETGEYRNPFLYKNCCKYDSVKFFEVFNDEDQYCLESQFATGIVYLDRNKDGVHSQSEPIVPNEVIISEPLAISAISKLTGYSIFVKSNNSNILRFENQQANRWKVVPLEHQVNVAKEVGKQRGEYNFGLQLLKERDLSVLVSAGIARAGRKHFINLVVENYAEDVDDYTVDLQLPSTWIYRTASLKPTSIIANKLEWNISTKLLAFEKKLITIEVEIPASAQVGDKFEYIANVSLNQDEDITNNKSVWKGEIVQSFDPNDKQVSADRYTYTRQNKGELIYTIRFMNTGSDTAVNVLIKDTLNRYLDPSTVRVLNSSHPVKMLLSSPDKFDFYFERIMLPDSSKNFVASQGFIQFAVKPNARFDLDAEILNRAAIYFDQNAPVATNTSVFRVFITELEGGSSKAKFTVLPNPANNKIHIILNESLIKPYDEIKIISLDGQTFRYKSVKGEIDISALPNAFYYIELLSKGASLGRRSFVKQ